METAFERCVEAKETVLLPNHFALEFSKIDFGESGTRPEENETEKTDGQPPDLKEDVAGTNSNSGDPISLGIPGSEEMEGSLLDDPQLLGEFLDRFKTPSGRWNISVTHRLLVQSGRIRIGRRAFADQIKRMFPDT